MQVAVHWQDADSSSANAVAAVFPEADIMVCGGHAGRAHKKQLEARSKQRASTAPLILYTRIHCIAKPTRYGNAHAIPYMACNVATARQPE